MKCVFMPLACRSIETDLGVVLNKRICSISYFCFHFVFFFFYFAFFFPVFCFQFFLFVFILFFSIFSSFPAENDYFFLRFCFC